MRGTSAADEAGGGSASAADKPGLAARQAATRLLAAVIDRKASLSGMTDAQGGNPAYLALGEADRALTRAIVVTALRHDGAIRHHLATLVERPLPDGARTLHHLLCVAAAQILYLAVPDHAAIDLAVEQAGRDPRNRRFTGLVNAVLRRLAREKDTLLARERDGSIVNLPAWFADRLAAIYGLAEAHAIGRMLAEPPTIDLTVKSDPAAWAEKLGGVVLPTGTVRLSPFTGSVAALPGFEEGAWWVQDAAASLPARLIGPVQGLRVADLCAAPGGKTAQLALAGAHVTALDQSPSRLARLKDNLGRLKLSADSRKSDLTLFEPDAPFDAVLLDAPCSSTGTVRRHPDVPFTKGPEDIATLAAVQERLLLKAIDLVKPGGRIVFSTCSVDPQEGEDVISRVLAARSDVRLVPIRRMDWPGLEAAITEAGMMRTTPAMLPADPAAMGGLDGFFAAVLERAA